jgi:hypothetical protein
MNTHVAIEFCIVEAPQPLIHLFVVNDHIRSRLMVTARRCLRSGKAVGRYSTRTCGGDNYVETLIRESLYSIHTASRVFCAAYKKTRGMGCIHKERRIGVALPERRHFH